MTDTKYDRKRIAWELERTAMGDGYYGNALYAAKELPEATPRVRSLLDRWATGKESGLSDCTDLCAFALQIYAAGGESPITPLSATQPHAEAHCTTCSCVPGMAPAIRFDATPAEKNGAVRDHLIRMGWTPPAEAQPCGCGEATCTGPWEPGCGLGKSEQHAEVQPVGVEGLAADLETIWNSVSDDKETNAAYQRLKAALAHQPAADGGFTAADMMDARQEGRKEAQQG